MAPFTRFMTRWFPITAILLGMFCLAETGHARDEAKTKPTQAADAPPAKPEIFELKPRGIQRGMPAQLKLIGTNLIGLSEVKFHNPRLTGELIREQAQTTNAAWIRITPPADLPRGSYELSVKNTNGESGQLKLYVDDLPQVYKAKTNPASVLKLPVSFWGTLDPMGDVDELQFDARAGESVVFDLAGKSIGSKIDAVLTLFDEKGAWLASNNRFDGGDPLLNFKIPATGRYRLRVSDGMAVPVAGTFLPALGGNVRRDHRLSSPGCPGER